MFETALIDTLKVKCPSLNFALEAAQDLRSGTIVIECQYDIPNNDTGGYSGQRYCELMLTCYATSATAAYELCKTVTNALRQETLFFRQYNLIGFAIKDESSGFESASNLYYREFNYNATYQEILL